MIKIKFDRTVLNRANNEEYQNLIDKIFRRISIEEFEELEIIDVVEKAKGHLEGITDIATKTNFHGNTQLMAELGEERRQLLMGLGHAIKGELNAETDEKKEAARLAYLWIRQERKLISKPRVEAQTGMVNRLQAEVLKKPKIKEALELIHADGRFKKIVDLTRKIEAMDIDRNHDIQTEPISMKLPRKKCNHDMEIMLNMLAGLANLEGYRVREQYYYLCLEIRGLMTSTKSKIALRKTVNAKGKNKNPEGAEAPEGGMDIQEPITSSGDNIEAGIKYLPAPNVSHDTDDISTADLSANGAVSEQRSEM